MTEWRPDDWPDTKAADAIRMSRGNGSHGLSDYYEAAASAMLSALLKWLDEPCKQHYGITHVRHNHIDCPSCMAELRGTK